MTETERYDSFLKRLEKRMHDIIRRDGVRVAGIDCDPVENHERRVTLETTDGSLWSLYVFRLEY
jgi:hypothetical protein